MFDFQNLVELLTDTLDDVEGRFDEDDPFRESISMSKTSSSLNLILLITKTGSLFYNVSRQRALIDTVSLVLKFKFCQYV